MPASVLGFAGFPVSGPPDGLVFTDVPHLMTARHFGVLFCTLALALGSVGVPAQVPAAVPPTDPGHRPTRVVLTWRDDPARTQAVPWRTNAHVDESFAEIAEATANPGFGALARRAPARTTAVPLKDGTAYYHEARFTALRPDTLYAYRVGDGRTWSEWFQFRTASLEPQPFSFIYFGDAQDDGRSLLPRAVRSAFMDAPRARFVVHAGDLVNVGDSDDQWADWFGAAGWMNAVVPQVPAVGDREYDRTNRADPRELAPLWRHQFALPEDGPEGLGETVYAFDYQGVRVIVLNSGDQSRVAEQAAWLEGRLRDNKNRWTVVVFHHPVFSLVADRDNQALRAAWQPVLEKYDVDLVLQGHEHAYGRGEHVSESPIRRDDTGTVYVVSVSGPRMNDLRKDRTWATRAGTNLQLYQVISVTPQALRFEARTVTGHLFDAFEIHKSRSGRRRFIDRKPELSGTY